MDANKNSESSACAWKLADQNITWIRVSTSYLTWKIKMNVTLSEFPWLTLWERQLSKTNDL